MWARKKSRYESGALRFSFLFVHNLFNLYIQSVKTPKQLVDTFFPISNRETLVCGGIR